MHTSPSHNPHAVPLRPDPPRQQARGIVADTCKVPKLSHTWCRQRQHAACFKFIDLFCRCGATSTTARAQRLSARGCRVTLTATPPEPAPQRWSQQRPRVRGTPSGQHGFNLINCAHALHFLPGLAHGAHHPETAGDGEPRAHPRRRARTSELSACTSTANVARLLPGSRPTCVHARRHFFLSKWLHVMIHACARA